MHVFAHFVRFIHVIVCSLFIIFIPGSTVPLCRYATIYISILLLANIQIASSVGLQYCDL